MAAEKRDEVHAVAPQPERRSSEQGKDTVEYTVNKDPEANGYETDKQSEDFQNGVRRVRAITTLWSKKTLWLMFCLLFIVSFVDLMIVNIDGSLSPYITSNFSRHGLLASTGVVATILSGCSRMTIAKIIDVWGRIEGFIFMLAVMLISMIMKATAQNIETYVGANTMFWTAHIGLTYIIDVMLADTTTLRNRMIIMGLNELPMVASTFGGPRIAELFYIYHNFRWAFGAFAIILFVVCMPVLVIMLLMQRRALKEGILEIPDSGRKWYESIWHYTVQFDVAGIILITGAFAMILLPFSIVYYAPDGWSTGYIIALLVLGVVCLAGFCVWEKFFAPVNFLPWKYLKEPTIIGSCLLYAFMFASAFCWNPYFSSYLQVVHRIGITEANYILNAFALSSAIMSPIFGWIISYTGNFKWTAYAGLPLLVLGTALLVPFRQPDTHVGLLTFTQVLVGLGTGLFATCGQLAVMVPVTHQEVAVVMAIWGMFGSIGASVGLAISGAIWNNVMPDQLYQRLPEESKNMSAIIFGDIVTQMSYLDGTPERDAIVGAYADVQRKLVIAGACFIPFCLASVYIWKDVNVKKLEEERPAQTKGTVF